MDWFCALGTVLHHYFNLLHEFVPDTLSNTDTLEYFLEMLTTFRSWTRMLLDKNDAIQETHYKVLNVKEDANYEEIRASYRSAVLSLHPDKLLKTSETSSSNQTAEERFLKVQKAWEILSNSSSRSFYDKELQILRQDFLAVEVADDLSLQDMIIEDAGDALELLLCIVGVPDIQNKRLIIMTSLVAPDGILYKRIEINFVSRRPKSSIYYLWITKSKPSGVNA
ncbi:hypothetical protein CR513_18656, partial [Mucuna pruriens]